MSKDKTTKRSKADKDPDAPKRPSSAYIFFANEARPALREKNPEEKITEIAKMLGQQWNEMNDKEKAKYQKMADKDKTRYQDEMSNYSAPEDTVPKSKAAKKAARAASGAPKRPTTAYFYFLADQREKVTAANPDKKMTEVAKILGDMWKEMGDAKKAPFNKKAEADKRRYNDEMGRAPNGDNE